MFIKGFIFIFIFYTLLSSYLELTRAF